MWMQVHKLKEWSDVFTMKKGLFKKSISLIGMTAITITICSSLYAKASMLPNDYIPPCEPIDKKNPKKQIQLLKDHWTACNISKKYYEQQLELGKKLSPLNAQMVKFKNQLPALEKDYKDQKIQTIKGSVFTICAVAETVGATMASAGAASVVAAANLAVECHKLQQNIAALEKSNKNLYNKIKDIATLSKSIQQISSEMDSKYKTYMNHYKYYRCVVFMHD
jgi:DNA repair exonuclease SbcCD ATPase subunit